MTAKTLPTTITTYDLLKTFAVVTMIIDHVGANFYPDDEWWRVVGRMSAPVWLFLIGYARTRDVSAPLWIGAGILVVTNAIVGQAILPICILGTILACRFAIDPVMSTIKQNPKMLYPITFVAFMFTIPTAAIFDYGSEIFLMVMLGYITRNWETLNFNTEQYFTFACIAVLSHVFYQNFIFFSFDDTQKIVAGIGIFVVTMALTQFRPKEHEKLTQSLPAPMASVLRFCGRKSLEIYVVHLLVFKFLALALGVAGFALFNFHIF